MDVLRAWSASFIFDADVSHTPARTHIEMTTFLFMPGEVLCRVQARSLMLDMQPHIKADPHTMNDMLSYTQRLPLLMLLLIRSREARRIGPGSAGLSSFLHIRRRSAPRKIPAKPDSSFLYARAQHGGTVRLRTLLSLRTGMQPLLSPEPGLKAGQFQRGGFLICAALLLRRSSQERRDCARPLRKRTGAAPQSRSRRGGLTRLAVCTVPAWLSPFVQAAFVLKGNYKLSVRTPRRQVLFRLAGRFFLWLLSILPGGRRKVTRPWNRIPETEPFVNDRTRTASVCEPASP